MNTVTRDDVAKVARALITLNGETTTLEVKNALRNRNYFAKQDEIREYMLDVTSKDGDIQYKDTGVGYRHYFFADDPSNSHEYNNNDICTDCGCSKGAVEFFKWYSCKPKTQPSIVDLAVDSSVGTITSPSPISTLGISTLPLFPSSFPLKTANASLASAQGGWPTPTPKAIHPDNVPANYTVTDRTGHFVRYFVGVTRGQAKARWSKATGRQYRDAKTVKSWDRIKNS